MKKSLGSFRSQGFSFPYESGTPFQKYLFFMIGPNTA